MILSETIIALCLKAKQTVTVFLSLNNSEKQAFCCHFRDEWDKKMEKQVLALKKTIQNSSKQFKVLKVR